LPLNTEALAQLRLVSLSATLYLRQVYIPYAGEPTYDYVKPNEGRWGTSWTLHATASPPTAWAEYCRHCPELIERADPTGGIGLSAANLSGLAFLELKYPVLRRCLYALTYDFARVLDVKRDEQALAAAGFELASVFSDDFGPCQDLAQWASGAGVEAIVAPSAAWRFPDGAVCAVLEPGRARLRHRDVVVASARPTVMVASRTTYRVGEKPSWID
jgi:hypothetical protein